MMMSKVLFSCPMRCHVGDPENAYDELMYLHCLQRVSRAFAHMERGRNVMIAAEVVKCGERSP